MPDRNYISKLLSRTSLCHLHSPSTALQLIQNSKHTQVSCPPETVRHPTATRNDRCQETTQECHKTKKKTTHEVVFSQRNDLFHYIFFFTKNKLWNRKRQRPRGIKKTRVNLFRICLLIFRDIFSFVGSFLRKRNNIKVVMIWRAILIN